MFRDMLVDVEHEAMHVRDITNATRIWLEVVRIFTTSLITIAAALGSKWTASRGKGVEGDADTTCKNLDQRRAMCADGGRAC